MNPGKVVDPAPLDAHLRLGPHYAPPHVETHFGFAADQGSFARAALRCVGIGECRRPSGSTMCPSFRATREEQHSTRGRAHLLLEMMRGEVVKGGFRSEAVKDALDLCLACKGCKSDCPVNVDMATYKAEFLAHYYEGHARPRSAWAFGFVHVWLRFAARVPGLAWLATQLPGARAVLRAAAGVDPRRRIPAPAGGTFRAWFRARPAPRRAGRLVVLWPDTFHDHFHPDSAKAAVEVLESAGFRVAIPARDLCCGRPLYDYGFVDVAKRWLGRTLDELRPAIRAGVPVVALEPSCFSVFRDELPNLYPDDQDAKRLAAQTFSLASFLQTEAKDAKLPALRRKVVVHGHCHQKSVEGMAPLVDVLRRVGAEVEAPDTGCCGMAGAFGFEAGRHHDVSIQCGELALMPAVRGAAADTILCADGFSCREQIAQGSQREAMHLADVLRLGLVHGPDGPDRGAPPERAGIERRRAEQRRAVRRAALGVALAGLGIAGWRALRRLA
jgi:Fe-S oxidoreductase